MQSKKLICALANNANDRAIDPPDLSRSHRSHFDRSNIQVKVTRMFKCAIYGVRNCDRYVCRLS